MFEDINELSVKPENGNSTKRVLVAVYELFYIYFKNNCNFIL